MCLGVPARIVRIDNMKAEIEIGGITNWISLDILDEVVAPADFVIVHSGFAIKKLDGKAAREAIALLKGENS